MLTFNIEHVKLISLNFVQTKEGTVKSLEVLVNDSLELENSKKFSKLV
jgi:hypothetical protein